MSRCMLGLQETLDPDISLPLTDLVQEHSPDKLDIELPKGDLLSFPFHAIKFQNRLHSSSTDVTPGSRQGVTISHVQP